MIPLSRNLGHIFEIYNDFGRKKPKRFFVNLNSDRYNQSNGRIEFEKASFISLTLKYLEMIPLSPNFGFIFEIYNDFGRQNRKEIFA